jgi:hypothetical protein
MLEDHIKNRPNIRIVANPSNKKLDELIRNAQICLAIANNPSGIKLKLINSMYRGRFIFSNESAFVGSGLEDCVVDMDAIPGTENVSAYIDEYMQKEFTQSEIERRRSILEEKYNNTKNAQKILDLIFPAAPIL